MDTTGCVPPDELAGFLRRDPELRQALRDVRPLLDQGDARVRPDEGLPESRRARPPVRDACR